MPSPITSSSTSNVGLSHTLSIDALLGATKWGGAVGTGTRLSFSFPWANSSIANFAEWNATTYKWSALSEVASGSHFGLNVAQRAAARSAILSWAEVANIGAYEVAESSSNVGDVRFTWTNDQSQGAAWGWAYYPESQPLGGDVSLNANVDSSTASWASGSSNYQALLHEVGHALGLKHPFDGSAVLPVSQDNEKYTVMAYDSAPHSLYYSVDGQSWTGYYVQPETPMVFDIAAIQYLYGANKTYHTGNDTYAFDPAKAFLKTLWDAAGNDTISASNFTLPCHIDLTPGSYSSLHFALPSVTWVTYDGTENLGIAYGCIIENAEGGSGNDTFVGNAANNQFRGNAGIDTVTYGTFRAIHTVTKAGDAYSVKGPAGGVNGQDTDTLSSIERIQFVDKSIALDIDGTAGQVYRLYQAAFNRTPDLGGLGFWIAGMDHDGVSLSGVSAGFINSAEFTSVYGANPTSSQIVTRFYENVLHRAPEQGGYDYWMYQVEHGMQVTQVLTFFSESAENQAQVIGVIQNGIEYSQYGA